MLENQRALKEVFLKIKGIDKDNNGYVTSQELDDILRLEYGSELNARDLKGLFRQFASIQNTILIDYKKFRAHILG
jgi:Ca2+-binding EF-hand superfamily protein